MSDVTDALAHQQQLKKINVGTSALLTVIFHFFFFYFSLCSLFTLFNTKFTEEPITQDLPLFFLYFALI